VIGPDWSPGARRWVTRIFFGVWALAVGFPIATLMASHLVPIPNRTIAAPRLDARRAEWQVADVLAADCECSRAVADHLVARGPLHGAAERVVYVGAVGDRADALRAHGFLVETVTPTDASVHLGVDGVPWLLMIRPDGTTAYAGGYSRQRPGTSPEFDDEEIWNAVSRREERPALPAFGCLTSERLRRTFDPLRLK
jgi:hypothetical protein